MEGDLFFTVTRLEIGLWVNIKIIFYRFYAGM